MSGEPGSAVLDNPQKRGSENTIVATPETEKQFPLTAAQVRYGDYIGVVQEVIRALDKNLTFPTDVACALFSAAAEDQLDKLDQENNAEEINKKNKDLPWPSGSEVKPQGSLVKEDTTLTQLSGNFIDYYVKPGVISLFPRGLSPWDVDREPREFVAYKVFYRLPKPEQEKVVEWFLQLEEQGYDFNDSIHFFNTITHDTALLRPVMDFALRHKDEYVPEAHPLVLELQPLHQTANVEKIRDLFMRINFDPRAAVEYLALQESGRQSSLLSLYITGLGYTQVLNTIRGMVRNEKEYLNDKENSQETHEALELLGKRMLGLSENEPFHADLNSVYTSLGEFFVSYEPNQEANKREVDFITSITESLKEEKRASGSKEGIIIVDLGCGTGRIANGLAEKGIPGVAQIVGIDNDSSNLEKAAYDYNTLALEHKTSVVYKQHDWNKPLEVETESGRRMEYSFGIGENSADLIILTGRTLHHVEDEEGLYAMVRQISAVLKKGGKIVFDCADPNKGAYLENRKKMAFLLQQLGLPLQNLERVEYVVDSADGKNKYNRYVPQIPHMQQVFKNCGRFKVVEAMRQPIAGALWQGSENIYFVGTREDD